MRANAIAVGLAVTLVVHGTMVAFALFYEPTTADGIRPTWGGKADPGFGLCGKRRCAAPEARRERRPIEPDPVAEMEVLEAAVIPRLGRARPKPDELPKLETYEQPEIVEDGINLDHEDKKKVLKKLVKEFDPKKAKRDPDKKDELDEVLKEFREDDPRKRAQHLSKLIGNADGEVGGQGNEKKQGNLYGAKVSRKLRKEFVVPPFLGMDTLRTLRARVLIKGLNADGEIVKYKFVRKSGNRAFDDAALAAIKKFTPDEGGNKTFPKPDPGVLRYINENGMKITLDGKLMAP